MRQTSAAVAILALLALPAFADKKVDDAVAKAEEQLTKGKPEEAIKTLQKLVSGNGTAEGYVALGRMQERIGAFEEAGASLTKAAELSSSNPALHAEVHSALSSLTLRIGSVKDALTHANEAVKAQATPSSLAALATALAKGGGGTKALAEADKAVAAGATSGAAHESRGVALLAMGRGPEADAAFRKALELDPKRQSARAGLAEALLAQNKGTEAVAEARRATEADAKNAEAFAVLGTAILAENPKNWNDAIAQAQQGNFLNPRSSAVQLAVGKIFEAAGNWDQASGAYRKVLEMDPGNVGARAAVINAQFRKGDVDGALVEAKKFFDASPDSGDANFLYGSLLLRKDRYEDAVEPLKKATLAGAGGADAYGFLGLGLQYTRHQTEAKDAYKKAVEMAPKNLIFQANYGLLLALTGEAAAGVQVLQRLVATPGYKDLIGFANLGKALSLLTPPKTEEALAAYRKALEIDPKNAQVHLGMAWAYRYAKNWDESISEFRKTMQLDPRLAGEGENGVAWGYLAKRDLAEAKAGMARAQKAGRNDLRLQENIARLEKALTQPAAPQVADDDGPEEVIDVNRLGKTLQSGSPRAKANAALALCEAGKDGVENLVYSIGTEKDGSVRTAVIKALGCIGPPAKAGIPYLNAIVTFECPTFADNEQMKWCVQEDGLKNLAREAVRKIQGR